jgi:starch synthase
MKVLFVASEAVPFAKTGGLADVAGVLPVELSALGIEVVLVLPLYKNIPEKFQLEQVALSIPVVLGTNVEYADIFRHKTDNGIDVLFIGHEEFFVRDELYATAKGEYEDNDGRFAFFANAALEAAKAFNFVPDIIHCNDWQTSLSPVYLKTTMRWGFPRTASLLTIHNLGYQGIFPPERFTITGLPYEFFSPDVMEFYGNVNYLKAGIVFSDAINTVSVQYSREIRTSEYGFGLEGLLEERKDFVSGITNGINQVFWDPRTDAYLPENYDENDLKGKSGCRRSLAEKALFPDGNSPILGLVGRLAVQKGIDILIDAMPGLVSEGMRFVVLGRGEASIEKGLKRLSKKYPENIFASFEFNEDLAHLIYAGSDIFLMPSKYEPCGLAQMIAMRYGTPVVARATGGLIDTVRDGSDGDGTGFLFSEYAAQPLAACIRRAVSLLGTASWESMQRRCMLSDFSWKSAARKYVELYGEITQRVAV